MVDPQTLPGDEGGAGFDPVLVHGEVDPCVG